MKEFSQDDKAFIREMMKSEGWRLFEAAIKEEANILRLQATQKEVELTDRLWYSAQARGYDDAMDFAAFISKK